MKFPVTELGRPDPSASNLDDDLRTPLVPQRVCFYNRSYPPEIAATGQLLAELAEGLVRDHRCGVTVVTGRPLAKAVGPGANRTQEKAPRREIRNGVNVLRAGGTTFSPARFAGRAANYVSYFFAAALAGFRAPSPDVVVSLTDPPIIGLAAWLRARVSGARFVFLCQDIFPEVAVLLEDFQSETVNRILDAINRFLIRKADHVVALGETMAERLIERKGADTGKVSVIHNWADCEAITPGPKENPFSLENDLADRFVVMHSGNMGVSQNLPVIIDAMTHLRDYPRITLAMVGDGVARGGMEVRVRAKELENVRFIPYQPKEKIRDSFAAADVFVVSLKEGLSGYIVPSKLYGILAAGRPYVAAVEEDTEVAVITRKYDCGLLARMNDPADLAEQVIRLHDDPDLARRLGENARRAALDFDRPAQIAAYRDLFRELAPISRGRRTPASKRLFDIALSGLGIVLSSPLWALFALLIKLEDGGPVFYLQDRVGRNGELFKIWKFRSMIPHAEKETGAIQAEENDPRITRIGAILRATAMDELPQLYNIFWGDMSFVGPRALRAGEKEVRGDGSVRDVTEIRGGKTRQMITPGLTGIAQIFGKHDTPRAHKFRYDILYIKSQNFWLDVKLIALSFWITLRGKWESREKKI